MKKSILFTLVMLFFVGCAKNEPTGNTYGGTTTEPNTDWEPAYITKGSLVIYNTSKYITYDVQFAGNTYILKPNENSGTIMVESGTYNVKATQYNKYPTNGNYKNQKTVYQQSISISTNKSYSYTIPLMYSLTIKNSDKSHSYYVTLNENSGLPNITVPKGGSVVINNLDAGYYHVFCEQRDYVLWGTNHEYDITLTKDAVLTITN